MTPELQQLVETLIADGSVEGQQVRVKQSSLEDIARQKGIARGLIEVFGLSEDVIAGAIARCFGVAPMKIAAEIETAPRSVLTEQEILEFRALPVFQVGLELTVAFVDPPSRSLRLHLQKLSGCRVIPVVTTISDFEAAVRKYGGALDKLQRLQSTVDLAKLDIRARGAKGEPVVAGIESEATMTKLVDELLLRAAKSAASDIHIEPGEDELMIRFRIDGVLQRIVSLPLSSHTGIIAVIKARAGMDMFERTVPLDGRITLTFADRVFDVRISTLPLLYGEKMVLRLLSKTAMIMGLDNLGFSEGNLKKFRSLLSLPNGIVLVTGPTGSGKSTTLYAGLNEIKSIGRNITTVENPVEYKLPLINQVQVVPERGLTFAATLRALLRQDPNVILVGEIRDAETGIIATEAALTGHLVLSTLHTNDAIGAIPRLVNLGIESFWVSSSVIGVLAQRLVRRICERCKEQYEPDLQTLISSGLANLPKGTTFFKGKGCNFCNGVGYKGRIAIHEVLIVTEEMRDIIYGEVTTTKLRALALANKFRDMYFDGMQKALAGITTIEEIRRVAYRG
ncbi:MAG: type II/IV secretion system protein [Ignavibacteria bacterium]|nr:type II/IV secretion system protein [Ignavibacteria bacterium]